MFTRGLSSFFFVIVPSPCGATAPHETGKRLLTYPTSSLYHGYFHVAAHNLVIAALEEIELHP